MTGNVHSQPSWTVFVAFDDGSDSRHLFGYPEPYTATNQAEPNHEVVLFGAVEIRHGITEEAWVDEEAGNTCDRVMLIRGVSTRPGNPDSRVSGQVIDLYSSKRKDNLTSAEMPPIPPRFRSPSLY